MVARATPVIGIHGHSRGEAKKSFRYPYLNQPASWSVRKRSGIVKADQTSPCIGSVEGGGGHAPSDGGSDTWDGERSHVIARAPERRGSDLAGTVGFRGMRDSEGRAISLDIQASSRGPASSPIASFFRGEALLIVASSFAEDCGSAGGGSPLLSLPLLVPVLSALSVPVY
jgi:hypothetical protein